MSLSDIIDIKNRNETTLKPSDDTLIIPIHNIENRMYKLPEFKTPGSVGADIYAAYPEGTSCNLRPAYPTMIPCGFSMELPDGYEAQIRPRSGLAAVNSVTVLNSPGTIDSDYRGEIQVILINHSQEMFVIKRGDRIAQMVIQQVPKVQYVMTKTTIKETERKGGFGSTGIRDD
jgi:dUTP pyrophosphatase